MMSAFLDALGIATRTGSLDDGVTPDPAKVGSAAAGSRAAIHADSVSLYLKPRFSARIRRHGPRLAQVPQRQG